MNPRSPDFICIGAQKAGPSWLRANLQKHPQIWMPSVPELHYFDESLVPSMLPPPLAQERTADDTWRNTALTELQRLLAAGDLVRPVDIFDLLFHGLPGLLAVLKALRELRQRQ